MSADVRPNVHCPTNWWNDPAFMSALRAGGHGWTHRGVRAISQYGEIKGTWEPIPVDTVDQCVIHLRPEHVADLGPREVLDAWERKGRCPDEILVALDRRVAALRRAVWVIYEAWARYRWHPCRVRRDVEGVWVRE
jgi:hypothetical protein